MKVITMKNEETKMENEEITKIDDGDVTPESLMGIFKGPGIMKMIIVTLIVHVVVMVGSSVPFLMRSVFGEDTSQMTKDERIDLAVADATAAIRKIAKEQDLSPQDISDQFASGKSSSPKKPAAAPKATPKVEDQNSDALPDKPKSEIEKMLEIKADGPDAPPVDLDDEDDIF